MRIITLVTQKGGSGKTTLAACLAVAATETGERAIALDLDPQQSLWKWGEERKADTPAVDKLDPTQLTQLAAILKALDGEGYTLAVLDTAGVASTATISRCKSPISVSFPRGRRASTFKLPGRRSTRSSAWIATSRSC